MDAEIESVSEQTHTLNVANSRKLVKWLQELQSSFIVTSHQANKLLLISPTEPPEKGVILLSRNIPACRGIALTQQGFYIYSYHQIYHYHNHSANQKPVYTPETSLISNELAIEELKADAKEQLYFVSSTNNALLKLAQNHIIKVWGFDNENYRLSGFAIVNGQPKYVTAFNRENGHGILMDIQTNTIICNSLSMPHSPRWYQNKLWLLNSGTGDFGYMQDNKFVSVTFCPGFIRGLTFINNYAMIGLSAVSQFDLGDPVQLKASLAQGQVSARSGIYLVHLYTGQVVHWIQFKGWLQETYDVAWLPGVKNPTVASLEATEIKNTLKAHNIVYV